jgi:hypothetical protein
MPKRYTDSEFIDAWQRLGTPRKVANALSLPVRSVHQRRRSLEAKYQIELVSKVASTCATGIKAEAGIAASKLAETRARQYEHEMHLELANGIVMVGSDAHYWPKMVTTAHEAFCELAKTLKPKVVILNGDILDGARISRHARMLWEKQPELKDEIAAVQDRCAEIERAANTSNLIRTIGNHDSRFENYLAANAPAFEEMSGSTLLDYLPRWRAGWAVHLNAEQPGWTVIRHRPVAGGIHSAYNSALRSGTNYVHGHLHKLQNTPWGDYRGRRYGVDAGTLAEPNGLQFNYTEGSPKNWASGFVVLTFNQNRLLEPEFCVVHRGDAYFRGAKIATRDVKK